MFDKIKDEIIQNTFQQSLFENLKYYQEIN